MAAEEGRVGKKNRARRGRETGSGSSKLDEHSIKSPTNNKCTKGPYHGLF